MPKSALLCLACRHRKLVRIDGSLLFLSQIPRQLYSRRSEKLVSEMVDFHQCVPHNEVRWLIPDSRRYVWLWWKLLGGKQPIWRVDRNVNNRDSLIYPVKMINLCHPNFNLYHPLAYGTLPRTPAWPLYNAFSQWYLTSVTNIWLSPEATIYCL